MEQTKMLEAVYGILTNDDELLRYLYYHPTNYEDDPLSPSKQNVTDLDEDWTIRRNLIKRSNSVSDLQSDSNINRILVYAGTRNAVSGNYMRASQLVVINSLVRIEDDEIDFRQSKINDRINKLIFGESISNIKATFYRGGQIGTPADGYVGYQLIYEIGSIN